MTHDPGSNVSHDREGRPERSASLDRVVDSSLFKLVMPAVGGLIIFMLSLLTTRLDHIEASQAAIQAQFSAIQTAQAVNAHDVEVLKQGMVALHAEMTEVHHSIETLNAFKAVIDARQEPRR